jgi:glucosylceramidase
VKGWVTTGDRERLLHPEPPRPLRRFRGGAEVTIGRDALQRMDGAGAALTDSAAWNLWTLLSPGERRSLLRRLFDPRHGAGLDLVRVVMGASDFARFSYTYDDMPPGASDPGLEHFSLGHDRAYILPIAREIRAINPSVRFMASPWSAPAWMKTSGALIGGSLRREYEEAYARYFVRFLRAYRAEGVPVEWVTVQNEPHFEPPGYPGMRMEAGQQARFVRDHLGPAIERAGLGTKILAWDHNWDEPGYPIEVLDDPGAKRHLAGSAFHCYGGDVSAQSAVHEAHPDRGIWFTECSGGDWAPVFGDNLLWNVSTLLVGSTRNWSKGVLLWNLALDERHGPTNGGCADCRGVVTVDSAGAGVTFNEEYYALAHYGKAVRPGARRLSSEDVVEGVEQVAFRNPDGSRVLLLANWNESAQRLDVRVGGRAFTTTLPARAVGTYGWR